MKKIFAIIVILFSIQAQAFSLNAFFSKSGLDETLPDVIAGKDRANSFLFSRLNKSLEGIYSDYSKESQNYRSNLYNQDFIDSFKYFANPYGEYGKNFLAKEKERQSKFNLKLWIRKSIKNKDTIDEIDKFDALDYLAAVYGDEISNEREFCDHIIDENSYLFAVKQACPIEFNNSIISAEHINKYFIAQGCGKYVDNVGVKDSTRRYVAEQIFNGVQNKLNNFGDDYCSMERKEAEPLLYRYQKFFNVK